MYPNQQSAPQTPGGQQPSYAGDAYAPEPAEAPKPVVANSKAPANPNSTQNALQISEVRDGVVIMNDGTFRAVIMCKSINFDLMSPQEREAVEFSYQGFLNSLYFPVQIFIRSQKVDLRPYLERMNKIRTEQENMLLGLLMEDYIAFLSDIAQQANIMDKRFYMVIKYPDTDVDIKKALKQSTGFFTGIGELMTSNKPPKVVINEKVLETAKTELRNRVQAVMQGLSQSGVQSLPLDTEELIELYYDAYNPDTATRQQIKDFNDLTAPIITRAQDDAMAKPAGGNA